MKKFLLFLCALMVSQIAGAWYLIGGGSLGNWDPASAIAYTSTEDNLEVWENISLTTDQEFKFIKQKNWDNNLGSGSNINSTGKETTNVNKSEYALSTLKELAKLREEGILTDEEFNEKKKDLLEMI